MLKERLVNTKGGWRTRNRREKGPTGVETRGEFWEKRRNRFIGGEGREFCLPWKRKVGEKRKGKRKETVRNERREGD